MIGDRHDSLQVADHPSEASFSPHRSLDPDINFVKCTFSGGEDDPSKKCFGTIALLRAYIANMRIRFRLALLLWVLLVCDLTRASDLPVVGAKIYPSPAERPIENGTILIPDAHILAGEPSATGKIPRHPQPISCHTSHVTPRSPTPHY